MINYTDIKRYDSLGWESYVAIPAYSHSFLKSEKNGLSPFLEPTDNMLLGSMVDAIITGGKVDMSSDVYPMARNIASRINEDFGSIINRFEKQVSYSATVEYKGFRMSTRGRLDFLLPNLAVIDLKITKSKEVNAIIDHFGYKNQVWHYGKLAQVPKGYLMIYSVPKDKTEIIPVDISHSVNEFWAEKTLKFGTYEE